MGRAIMVVGLGAGLLAAGLGYWALVGNGPGLVRFWSWCLLSQLGLIAGLTVGHGMIQTWNSVGSEIGPIKMT